MSKQGVLTRERLQELLRYDEETGSLFWRGQRPGPKKADGKAGCRVKKGFLIMIDGRRYWGDSVVRLLTTGEWEKPTRHVTLDGVIARVPLSQGLEAIIDAEDAPRVSGVNWTAIQGRGTPYAVRTENGRHIALHRFILGLTSEDVEVDHRNRDGLDNRKANLRVATTQQNQFNQKLRSDNSSGVKGVSWNAKAKKWQAAIRVAGRLRHLGRFTDLDDAAQAYAKASAELHGEYRRIA